MNIPESTLRPFEPHGFPTLKCQMNLAELAKMLANNQCDFEYTDGTLYVIIPLDSPFAKYIT